MNETYKKQVALLIRIMPLVYKIPDFAVHGGTAINLFVKNMPRYSVDVDLTYLPIKNREESLQEINKHLIILKQLIEKAIPGIKVVLNRLTDANYCGFNGSAVTGTTGKYDEHMGFDKMGNFSWLTRNENGNALNNLSFAYTGNQLKKVDNALSPYIPYGSEAFNDKQKIDTEYTYDKNGSTASDVNTGISTIQYNLLNLPDIIQFTQGHKNMYTYDGGGKKLEAVTYTVLDLVNIPIGTISSLPDPSRYTKLTTDYIGNMIYENGALKEILLPEGYYQGGVYYYYLKDHLGDTRVVINSSGTIMEKSHYYPSGMRFYPESTSNSAALPYRYNGKELEAMNGLNEYDYGARRRGAGLPIWTGVDPLAEKYYSISPYAYCGGNPILLFDPNGMDWFYYSKDGKGDPTWNWRDESEYNTGVKDSNGNEIVLQGQEAVVTAEGATDENIFGKGNNIFGEGAKLANFTVYGPGGKDDIKNYRGATMTADFKLYGAIDNGEFDVKYREGGKSNRPYSHWAINNTLAVNCLFGENPNPIRPYSKTQKDGEYFHTTYTDNGNVGIKISTGCILVVPSGHGENGWNEFNAQLQGVSSFHFVLNRTASTPYAPFQRYPLPSERDLKNRNNSFIYDIQRKP